MVSAYWSRKGIVMKFFKFIPRRWIMLSVILLSLYLLGTYVMKRKLLSMSESKDFSNPNYKQKVEFEQGVQMPEHEDQQTNVENEDENSNEKRTDTKDESLDEEENGDYDEGEQNQNQEHIEKQEVENPDDDPNTPKDVLEEPEGENVKGDNDVNEYEEREHVSNQIEMNYENGHDNLKPLEQDDEIIDNLDSVTFPDVILGNNGVGQKGTAVKVEKKDLTPEDQELYSNGYKRHDFNEYVSNLISVDRPPPDIPHTLCQNLIYPEDLPDTSVIIIFLNEAWSVLVRSVHSVINTSPPHLLREIILVDDFSDYDYLKAPLDKYMQKFSKVKILRNNQRQGLIRSRLNGAEIAKGEVLTFLDSHIECVNGWLQPLLARIKENASHVVWPCVPTIDRNTFEFKIQLDAARQPVGGFTWFMTYSWETPKVEERATPVSPIRSPTMAGGLFSIDRDYFYYIGSYDSNMAFWGAENLEMSFRIWMCGGTIEVIPCSVIGHVFRTRNVNANQSNRGSGRVNTLRTAMVWMDDYKYLYFNIADIKPEGYGDISSRLELRQKLKCHSFEWYLNNVYPSAFKPQDALMSGLLHSAFISSMCLQRYGNTELRIGKCHKMYYRNQLFYTTKDEELRSISHCVDGGQQPNLIMYACSKAKGNQHVRIQQDGSIFFPVFGKCVEWLELTNKTELRDCDGNNTRQKWTWEKYEVDFFQKNF